MVESGGLLNRKVPFLNFPRFPQQSVIIPRRLDPNARWQLCNNWHENAPKGISNANFCQVRETQERGFGDSLGNALAFVAMRDDTSARWIVARIANGEARRGGVAAVVIVP